ncbi:MAG TPA: TIGR03915 family putative DNA repair protein [Flavisolibacter sp.]|jgi:probable DNA metabolism protein
MKTVVYDSSFEGFLCAIFDVYEYKLSDVNIVPVHRHQPSMFAEPHFVNHDPAHSDRVWKGLEKKLSLEAQKQVYRTFLSEIDGIENTLLQYIQYAFASDAVMEEDYSHKAVLTVFQTAKKVWREKHRMEAFVRFQKTADALYYAIISPDYNVLPLIDKHFTERYADQRWMIYDAKRKYGLYYDGQQTRNVQIQFTEEMGEGKTVSAAYDESEGIYQQLWQQYFKSVNIAARKNTKLHIQHMPKRYWKYLPEKQPAMGSSLQERLTNWTYRRA